MTIRFSRFDIDFLFEQVSINYRYTDANGVVHNFVDANGNDIAFNYSELNNSLDPRGVREVSGSNNNLVGSNVGQYTAGYDPLVDNFTPGPNTNFGNADSEFLRIFQESYTGDAASYSQKGAADPNTGIGNIGGNVTDGTPRLISNLVASSVVDPNSPLYNPAADQALNNQGGFSVPATLGNGDRLLARKFPMPACLAVRNIMNGLSPLASSLITAWISFRKKTLFLSPFRSRKATRYGAPPVRM